MDNFSEQLNNVMRTAFLTAYPKIFTDIDYAVEIFSSMKNLVIKKGFSFQPNQFSNDMALEIEARYKAINCELDQVIDKDTLIIEIAAGLRPRHLQYQNYDYVELDLKPVIEIKKQIYGNLGYKSLSNNLYAVDLTETKQLRQCLATILSNHKHRKIIVISEGLFWYLTKEAIMNLARKFVEVFQPYDWYWISADCPCDSNQDFNHRKIISDSAKVKRGVFADYEDFKNLFACCGLVSRRFGLSDLLEHKNLFSAKFLSIKEQEVIERINSYTSIAVLKKA